MFTQSFADKSNVVMYAAKVNGQVIPITNKPYWKKDFLESALASYATYIKKNKKTFMQQYLHDKFINTRWHQILSNKFIADSSAMAQFPIWYFKFASGKKTLENDSVKISVWQYQFSFAQYSPVLKDSFLLIEQYYKEK